MRREYDGAKVPGKAETSTSHDTRMCAAYGCPLPGGITDSTQGSDRWLCRFHFGHEPSEFDAITTEVRRKKRDGELDAPGGETRTVAEMRLAMKRGIGR